MKKKKGRPSEYKGSKTGKLMRDFDMKFSNALWIHIQDTRYNKLKAKKQRKRGVN